MIINKGVIAMQKAGWVMATANTPLHKKIAQRYYDLAVLTYKREGVSTFVAQTAYIRGLKGYKLGEVSW